MGVTKLGDRPWVQAKLDPKKGAPKFRLPFLTKSLAMLTTIKAYCAVVKIDFFKGFIFLI